MDNRRTTVTNPLQRVWTTTYDPAGNVLTTVDANGNATPAGGDGTTTYTYNRAGRLTAIDYSDSTPDVTLITYDNAGNRLSMVDGSGTETRTYDPVNRPLFVARGSDTFAYTYDLAGNLTQRTYPGSVSTTYTYDVDNRLATAVNASLSTSYGYDVAGNLTQTTLPSANGHVETRIYDASGRLTEVKNQKGASVLSRFVITRDPVSNPVSVDRTGSLTQLQTYSYDANDRISTVCFAASCTPTSPNRIAWTYDLGNRLTETRSTGTTTYTYNAGDQLLSAGSTSYTYDSNGNELSAGSRTFTYDLANRLKTTAQGGTTTTYTYDGDGVRLQASTGSSPNAKTNFLWDLNHPLPQVALERNGNNVLQRQYIYGLQRIRQTAGTASYYHYDGLGSVSNLTSATGSTQRTWSYEPYGPIRTFIGSSPTNFWQFTGEYLDPTGLYHLRARQYDPASARFLSLDPLAPANDQPQTSSYAYAGNRSTVLVDPSGMGAIGPLTSGSTEWPGYATSPADRWFDEPGRSGPVDGFAAAGLATIARTTEVNFTSWRRSTIRSNAQAGAMWQAEVRGQLMRAYPSSKYHILENRAIRNLVGETIKVDGKRIRPDFQVINKHGRIAAIYEAKTGTVAYLSGPGQKALFAYRSAAAQLGYATTPEVIARYKIRTRVVTGRVPGRVLGALAFVSIGLGAWLDERDRESLKDDLEWLDENDPEYYINLQWILRCRQNPLCA